MFNVRNMPVTSMQGTCDMIVLMICVAVMVIYIMYAWLVYQWQLIFEICEYFSLQATSYTVTIIAWAQGIFVIYIYIYISRLTVVSRAAK